MFLIVDDSDGLYYVLDTDDMVVDSLTFNELNKICKNYKINISGFSMENKQYGVVSLFSNKPLEISRQFSVDLNLSNILGETTIFGTLDWEYLLEDDADTLKLTEINDLSSYNWKSSLQYLLAYYSLLTSKFKQYNSTYFLNILADICFKSSKHLDDFMKTLVSDINVINYKDFYYIFDNDIVFRIPVSYINFIVEREKFNARSKTLGTGMFMTLNRNIALTSKPRLKLKSNNNYIFLDKVFNCDYFYVEDATTINFNGCFKLNIGTLECYSKSVFDSFRRLYYAANIDFKIDTLKIPFEFGLLIRDCKILMSSNIEYIADGHEHAFLEHIKKTFYLSEENYKYYKEVFSGVGLNSEFESSFYNHRGSGIVSLSQSYFPDFISKLKLITDDDSCCSYLLGDILGYIKSHSSSLDLNNILKTNCYLSNSGLNKFKASCNRVISNNKCAFDYFVDVCLKYSIKIVSFGGVCILSFDFDNRYFNLYAQFFYDDNILILYTRLIKMVASLSGKLNKPVFINFNPVSPSFECSQLDVQTAEHALEKYSLNNIIVDVYDKEE